MYMYIYMNLSKTLTLNKFDYRNYFLHICLPFIGMQDPHHKRRLEEIPQDAFAGWSLSLLHVQHM